MPSLAEIAAGLVDIQTIVGVSEYTNFPAELKKIPVIGPYTRFNIEKIYSLKPDLVIASMDGNIKDQINRLRELKFSVVVLDSSTLQRHFESLALISKILGNELKGKLWIQELQSQIETHHNKLSSLKSKKVMLQLDSDPLVVVGRNTLLNEILEALGGSNPFPDFNANYPRLSLEQVIQINPDQIVILSTEGNLKRFQKMAEKWNSYQHLKAVKSRQVKVVQADELMRPGPRLVQGIKLFAEVLR
jgi:iron complex transport system substrate-binding protein